MKRVVILSLVVLELALVVLVWWSSTREPRPEVAPRAPHHADAPPPEAPIEELDRAAQPAPVVADAPQEQRRALGETTTNSAAQPAPRQSAVRGLVVFAADGKPVEGGEASLTCSPAAPTGFIPFAGTEKRDGPSARTLHVPIGPDGSFVFELAPGSQLRYLDVCATAAALTGPRTGSNAGARFARKRVGLTDRLGTLPLDVRVEVQRGIELAGRVVDADTGRGMPGASVRLRPGGAEPFALSSDPAGEFCFAGLERAELDPACMLECEHPDCIPVVHALTDAELVPGAAPLRFALQRGLALGGTLRAAGGGSVAGVALQIRVAEADRRDPRNTRIWSAQSDEHGAFLVRGLPSCEAAALVVEEQLASGCGVLALRRELGPLRANVFGLEFELETFGELVVGARLQGGFTLAPNQFEVIVSPGAARSTRVDPLRTGRVLRVPFGREVELVAYAAARSSGARPGAFARGRRKLLLDPRGDLPQPFVIELDETGENALAEPAAGSRRFELPGPEYLRGAVDVELLDAADGRALDGEVWVSLSAPGASASFGTLRAGRVRILGVPGTYPIEVETQGRLHDRFELAIPDAGLGRATWRVRTSP